MSEEQEKVITVNNQKLTESEFEAKKQEVEQKNQKLVEVKPGQFRTKLEE